MFHGPGDDGAEVLTSEQSGRAVLEVGPPPDEFAVEDVTEALTPSLWHPAPGAVVVLPERYTPTYAYPTLIWLCSPRDSDQQIREALESISTRNFVAVGLRAALYAGEVAAATERDPRRGLARYDSVIRSISNWVRMHPRRRYVVGTEAAARTAVTWLLARPEWFAGAIAIDSPPAAAAWHHGAKCVAGRRLLWLRTRRDSSADLDDAQLLALNCLGLDVATHRLAAGSPIRALGQQINRWVLEEIPSAVGE